MANFNDNFINYAYGKPEFNGKINLYKDDAAFSKESSKKKSHRVASSVISTLMLIF